MFPVCSFFGLCLIQTKFLVFCWVQYFPCLLFGMFSPKTSPFSTLISLVMKLFFSGEAFQNILEVFVLVQQCCNGRFQFAPPNIQITMRVETDYKIAVLGARVTCKRDRLEHTVCRKQCITHTRNHKYFGGMREKNMRTEDFRYRQKKKWTQKEAVEQALMSKEFTRADK